MLGGLQKLEGIYSQQKVSTLMSVRELTLSLALLAAVAPCGRCWAAQRDSLHIAGGLKLDGRRGPFQPRPFYDSFSDSGQGTLLLRRAWLSTDCLNTWLSAEGKLPNPHSG